MRPIPSRRPSTSLILLLGTSIAGCETDLRLIAEDTDAAFLSVQGSSADDVFVVGAADVEGPMFYAWDGADWSRQDTTTWPDVELWWVHPEADVVTAVGTAGAVLELDRASGTITAHDVAPADSTLFGVWADPDGGAWAVGGVVGSPDAPPVLLRRQGGTWQAESAPAGIDIGVFFKVHGTAADDVWIVGNAGITLHWDGDAWAKVELPLATETLLTVHTGAGSPVAVGGASGGRAYHHVGAAWQAITLEYPPALNGVCAVPGDVRFVGGQGAVLRSETAAGAYTADEEPLTFEDYHACWLDGDGGFWAVGGHIADRPLVAGVVAYEGSTQVVALP